jgi:hypothetical protein
MPYIPEIDRFKIREIAEGLAGLCSTPGELNYAITVLLHSKLGPGARYEDYRGVVGDVVCALLELYSDRGPIGPYEAYKRRVNGPVP